MRVGTNMSSQMAQRHLESNRGREERSLERLSSGSRITRAADDSAGLAISETLRAHIRSLDQTTRNGNDAISLVQVGEGGLSTLGDILIRLRELSIQAASDTIGDRERSMVEKEFQSMKSEMNRIAGTTEFNGIKLLAGEKNTLTFQLGIHKSSDQVLALDLSQFEHSTSALGIHDTSVLHKQDAQLNLEKIDSALSELGNSRATLGAVQNRLQLSVQQSMTYRENLSIAKSRLSDVDFAEEVSEKTKAEVLSNAGIAMLAQANQLPTQALKLLG